MDERQTTRPASEPTVGPAGHTNQGSAAAIQPELAREPQPELPVEVPAEFEMARRRLSRSAREAADRLSSRLRQATEVHQVDRRQLMATQRQIGRLHRRGLAPSPAEYWEGTAVPLARMLVDAALEAVADEGDHLGEAIDRFLVATSRSTLEPWISGVHGRAAIQRSGAHAVQGLVAAVPAPIELDRLGEWWQNRLQERALWRALPRMLRAGTSIEAAISEAEVSVLDSVPWCYGDRLLSAFELGHLEIRSRANELAEDLTARVNRHGQWTLVEAPADGPAMIRLTGP